MQIRNSIPDLHKNALCFDEILRLTALAQEAGKPAWDLVCFDEILRLTALAQEAGKPALIYVK